MEQQKYLKPSANVQLFIVSILAAITLCSYSGKYKRYVF